MKKRVLIGGFTLIELMIVVVVVAIIAAIAVPSYMDSVRKGRRNDGQSAVMEAAHKQEAYYAREASYTTVLADANISANSPDGFYTITIPAADASSYEIQAEVTNKNGQDKDSISKFRLLSTGLRQHEPKGGGGWKDGWVP